MRKSTLLLVCFISLFAKVALGQQTLTVTNFNDAGAGSLRAAITQYIGVGPKTIVFAPSVFNNPSNVITLASSLNIGYFGVDNNTPLIIDGSTGLNPGTKVNITYPTASATNQGTFIFNSNYIKLTGLNIYGNPSADGIFINAGTSTITNSFIYNNAGNGIYDAGFNNITITNNYIYSNGKGVPSNVANYFSYVSGIRIELPASSGIIISGNTIGTNLSNSTGLGNGFEGITIYGGSNALVANNIIVGNGNLNTYVPGGGGIGIRNYSGVLGSNTISGNKIGIDNSGNVNGNWNAGISLEQTNSNLIGGSIASAGNIIYGTVNGPGIVITQGSQAIGGASNNILLNNIIGNPTSTIAGFSNKGGISINASSKSNIIGSVLAPNTIANNTNFTIIVDGSGSTGNRILGNSTFCNNNSQGINLTNNGNNDYASAPATPPSLYINSADATPGQISGVSPANAIIDVYIMSPCESCGSSQATNLAQGKTWVGTTTANGLGNWVFTLTGSATKSNTVVTATDASNNTSEFSACYANITCTTPSASFTISTSNTLCSSSNIATLSIAGAQVSVAYVPTLNGATISGSTVTATSSNFTITIPGLVNGANGIKVIAYNNCTQTVSGLVTVTVNSAPTLTSAIGFTTCGQAFGTVALTGVTSGYTYSAYIGGSLATSSIAGSSSLSLSISTANLALGANTISITGFVSGCGSVGLGTVSGFRNPSIALTNALSSSTICSGSIGTVSLSGSQLGVTYYPLIGALVAGSPVTGTGSSIGLTVNANTISTPGVYVISVNAFTPSCPTVTLNTTATITSNSNAAPTGYATVPACGSAVGGTATITISGAIIGNTYAAFSGGTLVAAGVANSNPYVLTINNSNLSVGNNNLSITGSVSGCGATTFTTLGVYLNPTVTNNNSLSGSTICLGANGTVTLSNSQSGVAYYPTISGNQVGSIVPGTGSNLTLTVNSVNLTPSGTFTISVTASTPGCALVNLVTSTTIVVNTNPSGLTLIGSTTCGAATSATITISNTQVGNTYSAFNGATLLTSFVANSSTTILNISTSGLSVGNNSIGVTSSVAGCGSISLGNVNILVNPAITSPTALNGPSMVCAGSTATLTLSGAVTGVTYYPVIGGINGTPIIANSAVITLTTSGLSVGTTIVFIGATVSNCPATTFGVSFPIVVSPVPNSNLQVIGSTICQGGIGTVTVLGAQLGVNYSAIVNGTPIGNVFTPSVDGSNLELTIASGNLNIGDNIVSVSGTGCLTGILSDTADVIVNSISLVTTISGSNTFTQCSGSTGTFTASTLAGAKYVWSVPSDAIINSGQNTNSITVTFGTASGFVSVIPSAPCGIGSSANQITINITNAPVLTTSITGLTTVCASSTGITYSVATVPGASGYIWSVPSDAIIIGATNTPNIVVNFGTTSGNVSVQAFNDCGTSLGISLGVSIASPPSTVTITTTGGKVNFCQGISTDFGVIGGLGGNYLWSIASGDATITSNSTTSNPTIQFGTTPGSVNVSVQSINSCGTTNASFVANITSVPGLSGGIIVPTIAICANDSNSTAGYPFYIASISGANTYSWTVSQGTIINNGQNSDSIQVAFGNVTGFVNVSVTVGLSCGAISTSTTVSITPLADISASTITGTSTTCLGSLVSYSIPSGGGANSYVWVAPTFTPATASGSSFTGTLTATGAITVYPIGVCGKGVPSRLTVVANTKPSGSISGGAGTCYDPSQSSANAPTYSVQVNSGGYPVSYVWWVSTGSSIATGQNTNTVGVVFGRQSATLSVAATNLCGSDTITTSASIEVDTLSAIAVTTVTGASTVCNYAQGQTFTAVTVPGALGYTWYYPPTVTAVSLFNSSTLTSPLVGNPVTFDFGGSNVTLTVTAFGKYCSTSKLAYRSVSIAGVVDGINGPATPCITNGANVYSTSTLTGATGYEWSVTNGTFTVQPSINSILATFTSTGAGQVKVSPVAEGVVCKVGADSLGVYIYQPLGSSQSLVGPDSVCQFQTADYMSTLGGASSFHWTYPAGASLLVSNTDSSFVRIRFGSVSGVVMATPYSPCLQGFGTGVSTTVSVLLPPVANAGGKLVNATDVIKSYPIQYDESGVSLNGTGSSVSTEGQLPKYRYTWTANPSSVFTLGNSLNPSIEPTTKETKVYLIVSNGYCTARDSALVLLDYEYIPKAFSPNDDGVNDKWQIDNLYLYKNFKLTVYNKWGNPVKEFTSYPSERGDGWDGRVNGQPLPEAVYYYVLDFHGENGKSPRKGQVTIVR